MQCNDNAVTSFIKYYQVTDVIFDVCSIPYGWYQTQRVLVERCFDLCLLCNKSN